MAVIGDKFENFYHAPGGNEFKNKSVLAFHNSVDKKILADTEDYEKRVLQANRLGVGYMLTETSFIGI